MYKMYAQHDLLIHSRGTRSEICDVRSRGTSDGFEWEITFIRFYALKGRYAF